MMVPLEFKPRIRLSAVSAEPAFGTSVSQSLCSSSTHALSLSLSKISKTLKKKKNTTDLENSQNLLQPQLKEFSSEDLLLYISESFRDG